MVPESLGRQVTDAERREITRVLRKRFPYMQWSTGVAGLVAGVGWIIAFSWFIDLTEGTALGAARRSDGFLGTIMFFMMFLMGPGVGISLCGLVPHYGERFLRRRIVRRHLAQGLCLYCGYCLRGLPTKKSFCTCPECGKESPVAAAAPEGAPA